MRSAQIPEGPERESQRPGARIRAATVAGAACAHAHQQGRGALGGNEAALRICIDRILPSLKSEALPVTLEGVDGTLAEQGVGIVSAMAKGEIAPDQAATLMQTLASQARIVEVDELDRRVTTLEEGMKSNDKVP